MLLENHIETLKEYVDEFVEASFDGCGGPDYIEMDDLRLNIEDTLSDIQDHIDREDTEDDDDGGC